MAATVLVIDPYEAVRKSLCHGLQVEFPSIHVLEARDDIEAITCIDLKLPNLVIIDILLPGNNGVKTTQKIKSLLPLVPILILTMYEDEKYRTEVLKAGASVFIPKQKMFKQLIPIVKTHLAKINT
jgi:DNA-binding NarL/FixJ family response regulator